MAIKFALRGNSLNAYKHSGSGKIPLSADINQAGAPTVVADAGAIGGFAINYDGGGNAKGHIFPGFENCQKTGAISILARIAPTYSGSPAANTSIISIGGPRLLNAAAIQLIQVDHLTNGNIVASCTDIIGGGINFTVIGAWVPVSGTYYDIVVTYSGGSGANALKVYIDGVLLGQATVGRVWTAAYNLQSSILVGIGQNQILSGHYHLNEYLIDDTVVDPTPSGLNWNGAARAAFVTVPGVLDPTNSSDPGIANVRNGTAYNLNGVALAGTAAIPSAANVRAGTAVDATVGTAAIPAAANVRLGTAVDAGNGTAAIPAPGNVKLGVAVDATNGTLESTDPGIANVRRATSYKIESATLVGTLDVVTHTMNRAVLSINGEEDATHFVTRGDDMSLPVTFQNEDGTPFSLVAAVLTSYIRGADGTLKSLANASHTPDPDQVTNRGQCLIVATDSESDTWEEGSSKELLTKVVQGATTTYFRGKLLNIMPATPRS
jgi:hypothetical protein